MDVISGTVPKGQVGLSYRKFCADSFTARIEFDPAEFDPENDDLLAKTLIEGAFIISF